MCDFCAIVDLQPGVVSCGDSPEFPAWISPQRWKGWAVPYFDQETAQDVVGWANRQAARQEAAGKAFERYEWDGTTLWCVCYPDGPGGRREDRRVPTWGHGLAYGIGAGGWTWRGADRWS
ncbi:MAG: hypothetical protein ACRDRL_24955 [Sciscionella sp.]